MTEKETKIDVTQENEMDLLEGLLKAAEYKKKETKMIQIRRGGEKPLFSFAIRPLSADEVADARKNATAYMPNPNNPKLPPIPKETSDPDFLAWEIYLATEGNIGEKIWDKKELKTGLINQGHEICTNIDVIKEVLTSGEIVQVTNVIDEISGDNDALINYAKN